MHVLLRLSSLLLPAGRLCLTMVFAHWLYWIAGFMGVWPGLYSKFINSRCGPARTFPPFPSLSPFL